MSSTPRAIADSFASAMAEWAPSVMERQFWHEEMERSLIDLLRTAFDAGAVYGVGGSSTTFEEWLEVEC